MEDPEERDLGEPVDIRLSPEEAMKVLLRVTQDTNVDADPPVGGWLDEGPT